MDSWSRWIAFVEEMESRRMSANAKTTECPECGDAEYHKGIWREGNYERICASCEQSWFADLDYSKEPETPNV
jgi:hypothetical protein